MPTFEMPKTYDPAASERRIYEWWEQSGFFKPEIAGPDAKPFVISHPAAQHHRRAAPGSRHVRLAGRSDDPLQADARLCGAVGARLRPRRHRHAAPGGEDARQGGHPPPGHRPRGVPPPHLGLEGEVRRPHRAPAPPPGRVVRLGPHALHPGRGAQPRGARGVRAALPHGADLPRRVPDQLVARPADRGQRSGGGVPGRERHALLLQVPDRGRQPGRWPRGRATSRWRPRGPRRSWATPPWRCTPTTSAIAT